MKINSPTINHNNEIKIPPLHGGGVMGGLEHCAGVFLGWVMMWYR